LHLLFGFGSGSGRIWVEPSAQPGILGRKTVVLGCEDCHLLLSNPEPRLSLIPLLLPDLGTVAPETRSNGFVLVAHERLLFG
jgi:hypothetical protein